MICCNFTLSFFRKKFQITKNKEIIPIPPNQSNKKTINWPIKLKKVLTFTHVRPVSEKALQAINRASQKVYGCVPSVDWLGISHELCVNGVYKKIAPINIKKI